MLKKVLLALGGLIAILAIVIATRPSTYRVERSIEIAAPPAAVFGYLDDFREWVKWSPWQDLDPSMKTTFSGAPRGPGAVYEWKGNDQVGSGRMTILKSTPSEAVEIKLEFMEPFASVADTQFLVAAKPAGSTMRWIMTGEHNFVGKAMSLVMDMDDMVGPQFEGGLKKLAALAEERAEAEAAPPADPEAAGADAGQDADAAPAQDAQ